MVLGISEIQKLIRSNKLISNLSEREKNNPEGTVIDLRVEKLFLLEGSAFLGVKDRETPGSQEICSYDKGKNNSYIIKPGEYVLTRTMEEVNIPDNVVAVFFPRTTLFRSGIVFQAGAVNPGYHGFLNHSLYNVGSCDFRIEMGARYASIMFFEVKGSIKNSYRGQWQGGRESTNGCERQI